MFASLHVRNQFSPNDIRFLNRRLPFLSRGLSKSAASKGKNVSNAAGITSGKALKVGGAAAVVATVVGAVTAATILDSTSSDPRVPDDVPRKVVCSDTGDFTVEIVGLSSFTLNELGVLLGMKSEEEASLSQEQTMVYGQLTDNQQAEVRRIIKTANEQLESIERSRHSLIPSSKEFEKLSVEETKIRLQYQTDVLKVLKGASDTVKAFDSEPRVNPLANSHLLNGSSRLPSIWQVDIDTRDSEVLDIAKQNARRGDVVHLRLTSNGGSVSEYGLATEHLLRLKNYGFGLVIYVDGVAASGGMMMAAVADHIEVAPFAELGSIGVIASVSDTTARDYEQGVDYTVIVPEGMKVVGLEARQADINRIHQHFKDHIMKYRHHVIENIEAVSTGEVFFGEEAVKLGLADGIAGSREESLLKLKRRLGLGAATSAIKVNVTRNEPTKEEKILGNMVGLYFSASDWFRRRFLSGGVAAPSRPSAGSDSQPKVSGMQGKLFIVDLPSMVMQYVVAMVQSWFQGLPQFSLVKMSAANQRPF